MGVPVEKLGKKYDETTATLDPERAKSYAAATNDDNPAYESGKYAPPVFAVHSAVQVDGVPEQVPLPPAASNAYSLPSAEPT